MNGVIGVVLAVVELQFGKRHRSLLRLLLFGHILIRLDVDFARHVLLRIARIFGDFF